MPVFFRFKKGGIIAAFFYLFQIHMALAAGGAVTDDVGLLPLTEQLKTKALAEKLHQTSLWLALLHAENDHANIVDPNFLLSLPDFSPKKELQKTIDFLYRGERRNVCRFPARYLWLKQALSAPELPLDECPDIIEFKRKAPVDQVSIAFASENLAQPASMMGHVFLKFSGKNELGQETVHAISFYTDAQTLNLPKLFFDSMVIGKKGYFSLSPYVEKQQLYVDQEQRSIWEYQLLLDEQQKRLISLHLIELKQSHLTYFFQRYNCATVINFIVALSGKQMPDKKWWVTPRDVVKNASRTGLISSAKIITPSRWMVRALAAQIPHAEQTTIRDHVLQGDVARKIDLAGDESGFIRLEMARAYNQYAYLSGTLDHDRWLSNDRALSEKKALLFPDKFLRTDDRHNPVNAPGERQIAVFAQHGNGGDALGLTIGPVSHTLNDDNRSYASESGLQLFATTLRLPLDNTMPKLERFTLYSVQSLMPYDRLTGGISGRFGIALEPQRDSQLNIRRAFAISGALGLTIRIANDIDLYTLAGGGAGYTGNNAYLYSTLEGGALLRGMWDMKTIASVSRTDNQISSGTHYYTIILSQSKFINKEYSLNLNWQRDFNQQRERDIFSVGLKKTF